MEHIVEYIIGFLLGEQNTHLVRQVAYSDQSSAAVVIVPSSFFEAGVYMTQDSMPNLPLKEIEGVPLLFGDETIIHKDKQLIIKADIIASAFFLITRYEECLNRKDRDKHGRFIGSKSLPYRAGFLMRPIVDEYGRILRKWIRETGIQVTEPPNMFRNIYLTHDVDSIWQWDNLYRALLKFGKKIIKRETDICESLRAWYDYEKYDKIYTFPWMIEMDQKVANCFKEDKVFSVYFIKSGGDSAYDVPYYKKIYRLKRLVGLLQRSGAIFGLHSSYSAGEEPEKIREEKKELENILEGSINWNRHHYLRSKEPEDMDELILAGITDDFTMGYADVAGFRLGTSRAVKWINPFTRRLTELTLHPLTVMEGTLDSPHYMNLSEKDAYKTISELMECVREHNGEAILLWHNSSVAEYENRYQRRLYEKVINYLIESRG